MMPGRSVRGADYPGRHLEEWPESLPVVDGHVLEDQTGSKVIVTGAQSFELITLGSTKMPCH